MQGIHRKQQVALDSRVTVSVVYYLSLGCKNIECKFDCFQSGTGGGVGVDMGPGGPPE